MRHYTRAELNTLAAVVWEHTHQQVPHTPWAELPDYRRKPWRGAVQAPLRRLDELGADHRDRHRREARRTVRIA